MSEQTFDPKDLNQDGKVSFDEHVHDIADKTGEALKTAAGVVVEGAEEVVGQVKAYVEMTPEERKVKNEELKDKTNDIANKVADSTKGLFGIIKDGAQKIFKKGEK